LAGFYWPCDQWPAPEEDPLLTPACFSILPLELLPRNPIDQHDCWPGLFFPSNGTESILIHLAKVNGKRGYGRLLIMFLMVTPSIGREMHGRADNGQFSKQHPSGSAGRNDGCGEFYPLRGHGVQKRPTSARNWTIHQILLVLAGHQHLDRCWMGFGKRSDRTALDCASRSSALGLLPFIFIEN